MKFNKQQWEWIFYDWANSGYAMLVTTAVFPIYFKAVALQGGISSADSTAYWGYANSFSTLIIALLAPLLGALADYPHAKRRWLNIFTWLGIVTAMILGSLPANGTLAWLWLIIVYVISNMGYSGSNLFYDSFLTDVADDEQMDEVSSAGFGFGYLGGVLSFAVFLVAELTNGFGIRGPIQFLALGRLVAAVCLAIDEKRSAALWRSRYRKSHCQQLAARFADAAAY